MPVTRTQAEIDDQANLAAEGMDRGSNYPGMSYEEGVHATLLWVTGQSDERPMED